MTERLQAKIDRLQRENVELRDALERSARSLAKHESMENFNTIKKQRDILLMFARLCTMWAPDLIAHQADLALEKADLDSIKGDSAIKAAEPTLALQLLVRN